MHRIIPNKLSVIFILAAIAFCSSCSKAPNVLTDLVDPFIGTGGHGHTFPGAVMPFGMVQLSPDTRLDGWDGCSGYHYSDSVVYGFSHTHLSGTGVSDYGDILIMPYTGPVRFNNGAEKGVDSGYASRFSKENESASPGYYKTHLDDYNIAVELSSTERAGIHRYTSIEGGPLNVIIDLEHRDKLTDFGMTVVNQSTVSGKRISNAWAQEQHIYFHAEFSKDFKRTESQGETTPIDQRNAKIGRTYKTVLQFDMEPGEELVIKVGISAVDVEGAKNNLDTEIPTWDFDKVKANADAAWEKQLSKIEIEGGTEKQRRIFYTALYHTMIHPSLYSDADGRYRGRDLAIHQMPGGERYYTVFSLWDTFRALHPLFNIIERKRTAEFINTFLLQYQHGGRLPVWELAANETDCMIGYHSVPVIVDAFNKGITSFDRELALEAMLNSANEDRFGLDAYKQKGYISSEDESESVSKTLEYAYDDWCIKEFAIAIGDTHVSIPELTLRSVNHLNLLDPKTKFLRARHNGGWFKPFDPAEVNFNYTEANAWQYSLFAPHDIAGLVELMGGEEQFIQHLDALFSVSSETTGREQADITGLIGQYAHGNEPSHHMAYLYNYVGQPWKTQKLVRQIMDELYTDQPDGLSGNEDCGQMSAWYVLSAMGFYPVTPGDNLYATGSPLFDKATIHIEGGKTLEIITKNQSPSNKYIGASTWNGQKDNKGYISGNFLEMDIEASIYTFEMQSTPQKDWGVKEAARPKSNAIIHNETVPVISAESRTFTDELQIELLSIDTLQFIYYALNTPDTSKMQFYNGPFRITQSTTVYAKSGPHDDPYSKTISATFMKIPEGRTITLNSRYANQYAAGGDNALIDYIRGSADFRTGDWQGYREDLVAEVDLGKIQSIQAVGVSCLQDIKSWIWMPKEITIEIGSDGETWKEVARFSAEVPEDQYGTILQTYKKQLPRTAARYIRITAKQFGKCPEWHPGAGGKTWIFADEIIVE